MNTLAVEIRIPGKNVISYTTAFHANKRPSEIPTTFVILGVPKGILLSRMTMRDVLDSGLSTRQ
jgi:hypothetical protein